LLNLFYGHYFCRGARLAPCNVPVLEKVDQLTLFKFTNELQLRMEELLERKKADQLALEEIAELEAIGELDQIFTHINAMLVAQA